MLSCTPLRLVIFYFGCLCWMVAASTDIQNFRGRKQVCTTEAGLKIVSEDRFKTADPDYYIYLTYGFGYNDRLYAKDSAHPGPVSDDDLAECRKKIKDDNTKAWVHIIIIASALVLFVVVICVVQKCVRDRREREEDDVVVVSYGEPQQQYYAQQPDVYQPVAVQHQPGGYYGASA